MEAVAAEVGTMAVDTTAGGIIGMEAITTIDSTITITDTTALTRITIRTLARG